MLVYCIRHGQSRYNAEGRIQGQSDVPLSDLGRRQSEATAAALSGLEADALYSSPLQRAMETAAPIAGALGLEIQVDPRLMEIHAGAFQDHTRAELETNHAEAFARWLSGDPDFTIPGGESRRDLMRRGGAFFEMLRETSAERVVVVSHGGLIAGALKALLEIPAARHPFTFENGSINRLSINHDQVRLLSLNHTGHLQSVGLGGSGDL